MIKRRLLLNKLKELGFGFEDESKRVEIWKKKGGTERITIHKVDLMPETEAKIILRNCGLPREEIESFTGCAKT